MSSQPVVSMGFGNLNLPSPAWLAPVLFMACSTATAMEHYEGLAYAKGTERLLYREQHWLLKEGSERLVVYRCLGGEAFARKHVAGKGAAPDFEFFDARSGYVEGVRSRGGRREVFTRASSGAPEQRSALMPGAVQIIDAGFDSFVRQQWNALAPPTATRVSFLVPSRLQPMDFRLIPSDGKAGSRSFRLSLDTWYGRALPGMSVMYSARGSRLLQYEGIGNIRDDAGKYPTVRIEFPAKLHRVASNAEVTIAASTPLAASCKPS